MKLAFCLFKYFPFGGMQRNFLRIAHACARRGHEIHVYTLEWRGPRPLNFAIEIVAARAVANYRRYRIFAAHVAREVKRQSFAAVTGFNKIPGLDVYYAADPCFQCSIDGTWLRKLGGRYRTMVEFERAVFDRNSQTQILLLSDAQKMDFVRCYGTGLERFHLMPPVLPERSAPDRSSTRREIESEFGLHGDEKLILLLGSGFKTKGLDRAIVALAALPEPLRAKTRLFVIGEDNGRPYLRLAKKLGVNLRMLGGRDDAQRFLAAADLLLHPAYREAAGAVLLEAMAAGAPVLATDVCGYAHHIEQARGGRVLRSPFQQRELNEELAQMLSSPDPRWGENGVHYIAHLEVPSRAEMVADVIEAAAKRSP